MFLLKNCYIFWYRSHAVAFITKMINNQLLIANKDDLTFDNFDIKFVFTIQNFFIGNVIGKIIRKEIFLNFEN